MEIIFETTKSCLEWYYSARGYPYDTLRQLVAKPWLIIEIFDYKIKQHEVEQTGNHLADEIGAIIDIDNIMQELSETDRILIYFFNMNGIEFASNLLGLYQELRMTTAYGYIRQLEYLVEVLLRERGYLK